MSKYQVLRLFPDHQDEIVDEMKKLGADLNGIKLMAPKAETILLRLHGVSLKAANLLKQEMLALGGDCVLHREVSMLKIDPTDVMLIGTRRQYNGLLRKCRVQPFDLPRIGEEINQLLKDEKRRFRPWQLQAGPYFMDLQSKTWVMGILNVTPDSFSDGGKFNHLETAIEHAQQMVADGADIIDVGGESTRPGHKQVTLEEELKRVVPIVEAIRGKVNVPISVDTYKAEVARQAIEAGANIINDVWGCKRDPNMAKVAATYHVPIILMHNREDTNYQDLIPDMISDIRESIQLAHEAGVPDEMIILDPGIGFAKTYEQNLEVMDRLDEFVALGYPVLLGTSRKSMIGKALQLEVDQRLEGTGATVCLGVARGCQLVRVHDVQPIKRMVMMMDAMLKRENHIDG